MSIVEIIESDTGRMTRFEVWDDNKSYVVKSHTLSLKYQFEQYKELSDMGDKPIGMERYYINGEVEFK